MVIVFLMLIGGKPFKIFKTRKVVESYLNWFQRMSRYDARDYRDYQEFINLEQDLGFDISIDDVEIVQMEIIDEAH